MTRIIPLLLPLLLAAEPVRKEAGQYLRDHAETRGFMLGRPVQAKPTPDGTAVLFLRSEPRTPKLELFEFDVASGKTRKLLTPAELLGHVTSRLPRSGAPSEAWTALPPAVLVFRRNLERYGEDRDHLVEALREGVLAQVADAVTWAGLHE